MRTFLSAVLATTLLCSPAMASSKTFWVHGTCNGQDIVAPENAFDPWESVPIKIYGVALKILPNTPIAGGYVLAGNSFDDDIMGWGTWNPAKDENTLQIMYPPGGEFNFPANTSGHVFGFDDFHVDVHVACYPSGIWWQGFYTIFYHVAP
jgi:hypothetical protein